MSPWSESVFNKKFPSTTDHDILWLSAVLILLLFFYFLSFNLHILICVGATLLGSNLHCVDPSRGLLCWYTAGVLYVLVPSDHG